MTLANRVSAFFLAALATILISNSTLLYVVASSYLHSRFEEQLHSALQTLVAAVEVEDDDVKWETSDHTVSLGSGRDIDDIRWLVVDPSDRVVDHSQNLDSLDQIRAFVLAARNGSEVFSDSNWQYLQKSLTASHPKLAENRTDLEHAGLKVIVARRISDLHTTLNLLRGALIVLPAVCWLIAAIVGRWFCQRAIAPVREMSSNLARIRKEGVSSHLLVPKSGDELQDLGNAFNELLEEVFADNERQRHFAGDAAHQLRTPLTILMGHVEVALRRIRTQEEYQTTLKVVRDEVSHLQATIEALLFLARPLEGVQPDRQFIDMAQWLPAYLQKWNTDTRRGDLHCDVEPGKTCFSSPALLAQLLDILISNAFKYSPQGTRVDVRFRDDDRMNFLEVIDSGVGVAAEDRSAIFQPFFRTREARQSRTPGIGMGLALAKRLGESLGGDVICESNANQGSRFCLVLPLDN